MTTATEMFPDTSFLVSSGDQVNRANNPIQYAGWFFPEELTAYPIMPIIGNHDAAFFADYFNVPNETGWGGDSEGSDVEEHRKAMELAIDAVLMGHDHIYVRTYQMEGDRVVNEITYNEEGAAVDPDGTVYLTGNWASDSKYYEMQDLSVVDEYRIVKTVGEE